MNINDLKNKTVALASSGGLDSCTVTRWMTDHGVKVVSMTADLGQPDEINMDEIKDRMLKSGAVSATLIDLKNEIAQAGIQLIQSKATYEGGYWNTTGIARHVTVKGILREMKRQGINILVHGATGRGNDQVRFSLGSYMLDPSSIVYAPWRDESFIKAFGGRQEMIAYCQSHNIPIKVSKDKPYSTDANMLGLTHEAGKLEYLDTPADFVTPIMGTFPDQAPSESEQVTISFKDGVAVKINGQNVSTVDLFVTLNQIAGKHGVGIGINQIENRFVGIKSRGVYESPALVVLSEAFQYLLQQTIDRKARKLYDHLSGLISEQIYQGYYFDLTTQMCWQALNPILKLISGDVTLKLYKGNMIFQSMSTGAHSLYDPELSSMESVGSFDHKDSEGFIKVLGVNARSIAKQGQTFDPF